ncbi:MAG: hypothetical protein CL793_04780 [Chloroflexi bacterium]|nr:hypothetical protein [Chloroflexota bacterium]|tara:strand:+ start:1628 stop:2518 length:891 start_codon:yes stop_codon:yes gene_type:complete
MKPNILPKIDPWVRDIIVDPLSKQSLRTSEDGTELISPYGRRYPIVNGVYDLRLLNNITTPDQKLWKSGQDFYESSATENALADSMDYAGELAGVREVYEAIPIEGRCLDVGGHQGRLRAFLDPAQEYISCDPFLNVFDRIRHPSNLTATYPFLTEPVNFLCCEAEFLPFEACSFDTVHMRSVVDHFRDPELAFNEAYRTLKSNGKLVVGLYVLGGKQGKVTALEQSKEMVKHLLDRTHIREDGDHHIWHPTYQELVTLIETCGFKVETVHWQKNTNDQTCYIQASKTDGLSKIST